MYVAPEDQSPDAAIGPREVPRHPRYNPEREGAGAIRVGCRYCVALYELNAGKLAVATSFLNRVPATDRNGMRSTFASRHCRKERRTHSDGPAWDRR